LEMKFKIVSIGINRLNFSTYISTVQAV